MNQATRAYIASNRNVPASGLVAHIVANRLRTVSPIETHPLASYLLMQGLSAVLRSAATNEALPAQLRAGIQEILDCFSFGIQRLNTNELSVANKVGALLEALQSVGLMTAQHVQTIQSMGGGLHFTQTTQQEVQELLDELDALDVAAATQRALRQRTADAWNALQAAMSSGAVETWEQAVELFGQH